MKDQLELSESDVFERFYQVIEKHRLKPDKDKLVLGDFYELISELEKQVSEGFSSKRLNRYTHKIIVQALSKFITVFEVEGLKEGAFFSSFNKFIYYLFVIIEHAGNLREVTDIDENLFGKFPSLTRQIRIDNLNLFEAGDLMYGSEVFIFMSGFVSEIDLALQEVMDEDNSESDDSDQGRFKVLCDDYLIKEFEWVDAKNGFVSIAQEYYLNLDIYVDSEKNVSDLMFPTWSILKAIEGVKGVKTKLLNIVKGSLISKSRVIMKDLVSKEELKEVLLSSKEAAKQHYIQKPIDDGESTRAETGKIKVEKELLEKQAKNMQSETESKLNIALDLERKQLENDQLKIINQNAKIDGLLKLSELASKGFIEADSLRIEINSILFLLKDDNKLGEADATSLDDVMGTDD